MALIWGVNIPIMKNGLDRIDVFVFNGIRLTISAMVLVGFAVVERRRGIFPKDQITGRQVILYAVLVSAVYQLLFLLGVARTTAGNTALIIATVPMWTALLARLFLAERLRALAWSGLTISLVGTLVVALQKGDVTAGHQHLVGNAIVLTAALIWASGTVYSRPLLKYISPLQLSAAAAIVGLPVHVLFAASHWNDSLPVLRSPSLWLIIAYSGVLSSGLAQPMWNFGVRQAGAAHAAVVQNLIPLVAVCAAWLTRGERATMPQILGGTLILGGLAIMRAGRHAPMREIEPDPASTEKVTV